MEVSKAAHLQPSPGAWRDLSEFNLLDESWSGDRGPTSSVSARSQPLHENDQNASSRSSLPPAKSETPTETQQYMLQSLHLTDANGRKRRKPRQDSEALTDSELLHPGPSSPTYRLPSHQMTNASSSASSEDGLRASLKISRPRWGEKVDTTSHEVSSSRSDRSQDTDSSGEKQGTKGLRSIERDRGNGQITVENLDVTTFYDAERDEGESDDRIDQYGSAKEHVSISAAMNGGDEVTFIEHSEAVSLPNFMKPDWAKRDKKNRAKDMFTPLKLQSMFDPPSFVQTHTSTEKNEIAASKQLVTQEGRPHVQQPPTTTDLHERSSISATESGAHGRPSLKSSENVVQERNFAKSTSIEEESHSPQQEQLPGKSSKTQEENKVDVEQDTPPDNLKGVQAFAPSLQFPVPQCQFTFSSPMSSVPVGPSTSHAPLRLFHWAKPNAEIEQILNTPRSPAKTKDARRIVRQLVEEESREHRELKRLRLDRMPSPELRSDPMEKTALLQTSQQSQAHETIEQKDYVREAPAFMQRLRGLRSIDENRLTVSHAFSRGGAKAPTPETSMLRGQLLTPHKKESPRKLLRRWSAAHEIDEEIAEEREADEDIWNDTETSSPNLSPQEVPDLHIDPPTEKSAPVYSSLGKKTDHPGMMHISPEAIAHHDMERMANGRMTFDRKIGKWVHRHSENSDTGQETSDPFQGIDTIHSPPVRHPDRVQVPKGNFKRSLSLDRTNDAQEASLGMSTRSHIAKLHPNDASPSVSSNKAQLDHSQAYNPVHFGEENGSSARQYYPPIGSPNPTPRSILKTGGASQTPEKSTPIGMKQARRSISFADGVDPLWERTEKVEKVEDLLRQLAILALGPDDELSELTFGGDQHTPTRAPLSPSTKDAKSPWRLSVLRGNRRHGNSLGEASFMTDASFDVAHDRLLELITDVAPFEEDWRDMRSIDLRGRRVDSLNRCKEFLPRLEEAFLGDNEISYLSGLPYTLRHLSIARNRLPETAAFNAFINLETLDVSCNRVSLRALDKLIHLRHLRADDNEVVSIEGIEKMDKLETLHLRNNHITTINIKQHQWPALRDLVLSHNRLIEINGIGTLRQLRSLNLDHNSLANLDLGVHLPSLKQLRISGNSDLSYLDISPAPQLRTLYADECALDKVVNIGRLSHLQNLSLRQQRGTCGLQWPAREIRDVKRLFLSGNAFRSIDIAQTRPLKNSLATTSSIASTTFYGLVYLELSACQLTSLPAELASTVPNLRHLNADYNLLETLPRMSNLQRLKRLSLVGCRLSTSRKLIESLYGCDELVSLDIRLNPCTLGLYPPVFLSEAIGDGINRAYLPPIPHPSLARPDKTWNAHRLSDHKKNQPDHQVGEKSFFHKRHPPPPLGRPYGDDDEHEQAEELPGSVFVASDRRFVRTLPPQYRLQRLLHRGTLAMACPALSWLDGLLVDEEEVHQADRYYQRATRRPSQQRESTDDSASHSIFSHTSSEEDFAGMNL